MRAIYINWLVMGISWCFLFQSANSVWKHIPTCVTDILYFSCQSSLHAYSWISDAITVSYLTAVNILSFHLWCCSYIPWSVLCTYNYCWMINLTRVPQTLLADIEHNHVRTRFRGYCYCKVQLVSFKWVTLWWQWSLEYLKCVILIMAGWYNGMD